MEVRNLGIVGGSVTGEDSVGGLVGHNNGGKISMCYATGTVAGGNSVGGLVGDNGSGKISMCYATGSVTGEFGVGGFVGYNNSGSISACYATGNATATNDYGSAGGFAGTIYQGSISACYATGTATATATATDGNAGGFVGYSDSGTISACYATGTAEATGTDGYAGGLVGNNEGTVNNSHFDYETSGISSGEGAQSTSALQTPTVYDDDTDATNMTSIYEAWNVDVDNADTDDDLATGVDDPWDFGTSSEYPALKVDFDNDGDTTAYEFGGQGRSAPLTIMNVDPIFGFVGTMVTIEGQSFGATPGDNTVTFLGDDGDNADDRVATVNTASTTELVVEVPVDAITGLIQVEANGATAVSASDFTVKPELPNNGDLSLIDITTLEQLDAMRYDLNGDGVVDDDANATAYGTVFGAPSCTDGCTGYELMANLDFKNESADPNNYSIWAEGSTVAGAVAEGWVPIADNELIDPSGDVYGPRHHYIAIFEGNDHMISNLYINRATDFVGLFGVLGSGGEVRNVGIEGGSVRGSDDVGGLVGYNYGGTISACYATGNAETSGVSGKAGGLVGWNRGTISACYATGKATATGDYGIAGGLVGQNSNSGTIRACYATGNATAAVNGRAGGLVGHNGSSGTIRASHATGNTTTTNGFAGGLVGYHAGTIRASYATGDATTTNGFAGGLVGFGQDGTIIASFCTGDATATGSGTVGGLVGDNTDGGTITKSYFDSDRSSATQGVGKPAGMANLGKTTAALQGPLAYGGIYVDWNVDVDDVAGADDPWDFGTNVQYPALKVDFDGDTEATAYEFGGQGRSAPLTITTVDPMFWACGSDGHYRGSKL